MSTKLPPLPEPDQQATFATARSTKSVRDGSEMGGYEKTPPRYNAETVERLRLEAIEAYKQQGEAVAPTTQQLDKLLNGFARACAFSDDRYARLDAARRIHELFAQAQPAKQQGGSSDMNIELPPLPEWSKMDNLGNLVPSEIRQGLQAYALAAIETYKQQQQQQKQEWSSNGQ